MGTSSNLADYRTETESLHAELVEQIPDEVVAADPIVESEVRYGTESGAGDDASSPAWWQITDFQTLINAPGTSESTAGALGEYLVAEGWSQERAARTGGAGPGVTDQYRRSSEEGGGWFIEIGYAPTTQGRAETLQIVLVSPTTTRGETPPPRAP